MINQFVGAPNLGVPTNQPTAPGGKNEKWKPGILGVVINQYKRVCTIDARVICGNFSWQSNFHDHIIRNDELFQRIADYIRNNITNWKEDKFYNK